jgi:hypothetical protein
MISTTRHSAWPLCDPRHARRIAIRDGMGQSQIANAAGAVDAVITNAVIHARTGDNASYLTSETGKVLIPCSRTRRAANGSPLAAHAAGGEFRFARERQLS